MRPKSPGISYRLLSLLLLPIWIFHAISHGRKNNVRHYYRLRCFGKQNQNRQRRVWVHASSVGEVESISPLVEDILGRGELVLFTSFTATGYSTIQNNFAGRVDASIIPIDFIVPCWRFFRQQSIKCCLLMETELWPELLFQAARKRIPIIQVNARLSDKSLKAPLFIRSQLRRTLDYLTLHLTRYDSDKTDLIALGALPQNIRIIGNLKTRQPDSIKTDRPIVRPYLLLASSHANEEFDFLQQRPAPYQSYLIVIAPRHPKRTDDIQQQLNLLGIKYAVRSLSQPITKDTEVYLADTLGELKQFMAHTQVVVMGGSFDQTGGHNLIEPAYFGCAIITGPSDSDIQHDIALLGQEHGVLQVDDMAECWDKVDDLIRNPAKAEALGANAKQAVLRQSNIGKAYLAEIVPYLVAPKRSTQTPR
ncbi:MAG: 3-deoxy-D-manno-octulosonic-acid transferase [Polaribacter sp.]|jgi:3-deoxy-D-manno-octulosonic-acid transferase